MARLPALPGAPRPTAASDGVSVPTRSLAGEQQLLGAVGQVADQAFNAQLDDMKRANEVVRLTKEREFNTAISEAQGNLKRNKPGDWVKQISESSSSIRERLLADEELAPAVKDGLQRRFQDYEARTIQQVGRDAKIAQVSILKDETALRLEGLQSNGQWDEADDFIKESAGTLDLTGPELQRGLLDNKKKRKQWEKEEEDKRIEESILANPAKYLEKPTSSGNLGDDRRRKKLAQSALREVTAEKSADILDLIVDDRISTPKEIDKMTEGLRPVAREKLKAYLADHLSGKHEEAMKNPKAQAYLSGTAQKLIDGYDPNGNLESFDADFVEIDGLLRQIQPGATRDELNRRLDEVRSGKIREVKTNADAARSQLKKAFNDGVLGKSKEVETGSLGEILDDGFLSEKRLKRLGVDDKTAAFIAAGGDDEIKPLDALRSALVGKDWANNADWRENQIIEAIQGYKGNTYRIPKTPPQEEDNDPATAYGQALDDLNQFIKLNPDAKAADYNTVIQESLGGAKAYSIQQSLIPSRPVAPPVVGPQAYNKRSDIPYNGVPANVRYNNPAAAYPRKSDEKYGVMGHGVLNGGKQGQHKIGRFPTPVHGAAANFDLFADKYVGMTAKAAVSKWRGNAGRGEKVVVPSGYDPDMKITKDFLDDPKRAIDFFKKMALHESPGFKGMSDSNWASAWKMWKQGGAV